jgi:glycosyltransferase involved in cell wall biosynthesis
MSIKVLQLSNKPPQPTVDGGCIAINNISKGLLAHGVQLKIITISTEKHPFQKESFDDDFLAKTDIEGVFIDTRINVIDAFSALVTADSYNVSRFFSPDFSKRLQEVLQEEAYDIVHLESLFLTPYIHVIRKYSRAKIVLRSHNLEHLIWQRLANSTGNKAKKIYLKHLASKLKKYEKSIFHDVDGIAAISFEDTKRFKALECKAPIVTIPFGIDLRKYTALENSITAPIKLFHIGAMDWEPNKEAVNWLLDDIWPKLAQENIELHLAGRSMPNYILQQGSDKLTIYKNVDSAINFMNAHDVLIAPLLSGSGMRVKMIEAMALGKTIITTKIGAEGIHYTDGENIIIANTSKEIVAAVRDLMKHPKKAKEIGINARKLVEKEYDNAKIIEDLLLFYRNI